MPARQSFPPLPEAGRRDEYYDTKVQGLQFRISAPGVKTFYVYRWVRAEGKAERIMLGRFPDMTIENARKAATVQEAVAILRSRQPDDGADASENESEFVFPSESKTGHIDKPKKGWARILERAEISDLRVHDLRRSLGSWQAKGGASLAIIGKSLGHARPARDRRCRSGGTSMMYQQSASTSRYGATPNVFRTTSCSSSRRRNGMRYGRKLRP